jgi:bifunctional non-homologous end joining protein LigD
MTDEQAPGPGSIPWWAQPQLATLTKDRFSDPEWLFERKLDGERMLAFRDAAGVRLLTRNDRDVTATFPEVADALRAQAADDLVVDGEVVAFRDGQTSFSMLQQRLGVVHPAASLIKDFPVSYYIFDVLFAGGRDIRGLPQRERKERLNGLLEFTGPLRYTEHRAGDGEAFYRQACVDGWEGLIAKRADAPYAEGRTRNAGTRQLAVRQRQAAAGGRALGRAAPGRSDRIRRVDHRRPAAPAPVRGPPRR